MVAYYRQIARSQVQRFDRAEKSIPCIGTLVVGPLRELARSKNQLWEREEGIPPLAATFHSSFESVMLCS